MGALKDKLVDAAKRVLPPSTRTALKMQALGAASRKLWRTYARAKPWPRERRPATYAAPDAFDAPLAATSMVCRADFFRLPLFAYWDAQLHRHSAEAAAWPFYERKRWERVYVLQALHERGVLTPGARGLGFAVGLEPLPAFFAARGCDILATDLSPDEPDAASWIASHEHAGRDLAALNADGLCPADDFARRVAVRYVDMNAVPDDLTDFDFCWSICAFEHLGTLRRGMDFVRASLATLKPGGVAVHTTELNLSSDRDTEEADRWTVLYRAQDLRRLAAELEAEGHYVWPLDLDPGDAGADRFVDVPPYNRKGIHLHTWFRRYAVTPVGLIIRRGAHSP